MPVPTAVRAATCTYTLQFVRMPFSRAAATTFGAICQSRSRRLHSARKSRCRRSTVRWSYTVHEGTQPGDVVKLKGKCIQSINGRGRGDQYVRVTVEVPKNLSKRQKELLQEFEQNADEKNYQKRKSFFGKIKDLFED